MVDDSAAILFEHGSFGGRAQLLGPGMHGLSSMSVGNDAVSSLKLLRGYFATLYEHDNFVGRSKLFQGSTGFVGQDFNDVASSVAVGVIDN
jgi:hypothetical protein